MRITRLIKLSDELSLTQTCSGNDPTEPFLSRPQILMVLVYLLLETKQCQMPLLSRDELPRWSKPFTGTEISTETLRAKNQTALADDLEHYVVHYYDLQQLCHMAMAAWCLVILLLSLVNVVPSQEDFKVFTILLVSGQVTLKCQRNNTPINHAR